jgi:hypothetical protein
VRGRLFELLVGQNRRELVAHDSFVDGDQVGIRVPEWKRREEERRVRATVRSSREGRPPRPYLARISSNCASIALLLLAGAIADAAYDL